jgi:hypothetical protein
VTHQIVDGLEKGDAGARSLVLGLVDGGGRVGAAAVRARLVLEREKGER